jgi:hypothetical protein
MHAIWLMLPAVAFPQRGTESASPRYAYVTDCFGTLSKLDLVEGRMLSRVELQRKTKLVPASGDVSQSTIDGCAVYGGAYARRTNLLYMLAPATGSYQPSGRRFRLLWFHLPEVTLQGSADLPGTVQEQDEPALEVTMKEDDGVLVHAGQWLLLSGKQLAKTSAPASTTPPHVQQQADGFWQVDISGYRTRSLKASVSLTAELLQQSGNTSLLWMPGKSAVVLSSPTTIEGIDPGFPTTEDSVQLTPGGKTVVAQESNPVGSIGLHVTKSRLALLSVEDGHVLRAWNQPGLAKSNLIAVSPGGVVILLRHSHFLFVNSDQRFPDAPVRTYPYGEVARMFTAFADR